MPGPWSQSPIGVISAVNALEAKRAPDAFGNGNVHIEAYHVKRRIYACGQLSPALLHVNDLPTSPVGPMNVRDRAMNFD